MTPYGITRPQLVKNSNFTCQLLTHWVTHICISKIAIIGSDNGLSPGQCQAIILTNAEIFLIWPLGTNVSEIFIEIHIFSFKKMHLKMSSAICQPFCFRFNVLILLGEISQYHTCVCWYPVSNAYRKISNIRRTKSQIKCFSSRLAVCCLCSIHWSQVLSREWWFSWSSADRRCSNYIWVTNQQFNRLLRCVLY